MGFWAKIGWLSSGLLVLTGIALMFWLDWLLGTIFSIFCIFVFWFVFGVLKRKVDLMISDAAKKLGLVTKTHPFRYISMMGEYKGRPVRISYESATAYGLGAALVTGGAAPGFAALDVRNITLLTLEHGHASQKKRVLIKELPAIMVKKNRLMTAVDGICTDPGKLKKELDRLAKATPLLSG